MENETKDGFKAALSEALASPEFEPFIIAALQRAGFTVRPRPENLN